MIGGLIERMIAAGMSPGEAGSVAAEIYAAGVASVSGRSSSALRQQRYRDRKASEASVTKRNESVTKRNADEPSSSVTNRNESVTNRNDVTPPYIFLTTTNNNLDKKERKKDGVPRPKRNAPLRDDWSPSPHARQVAEQCGQDVGRVEQIFRDYLKSSGKLYADYDAAFNNFIRNQQRFGGGNNHAPAKTQSGGSILAAIDRQLAAIQQQENANLAATADTVFRISQGPV